MLHLCHSLQRIGEEWITDLMKLRDLLPLAEDAQLMREVHRVKKVHIHVHHTKRTILASVLIW